MMLPCIAALLVVGVFPRTPHANANLPVPPPGVHYACYDETHLKLTDVAQSVRYDAQNEPYQTMCWYMECPNGNVEFTLTAYEIKLRSSSSSQNNYLTLYSTAEDAVPDYYYYSSTFDLTTPWSSQIGETVVLNSSAFLQFRTEYDDNRVSLAFDVRCVDAAPSPIDTPEAVCGKTELLSAAGNVDVVLRDNKTIVHCYHIECDSKVLLNFSGTEITDPSYLTLYSSENGYTFGGRYILNYIFNNDPYLPSDTVLQGSGLVQYTTFLNTDAIKYGNYRKMRLNFSYTCVDANYIAPPTNAPATSAPGVDRICDEYPWMVPATPDGQYDFGHTEYKPSFGGISDYTVCYTLDCGDQDIRLESKVYEYKNSRIDVFSSMDGENYILANSFLSGSDLTGPNLKGKVLLQLTMPKTAYLDLNYWVLVRFQYWCVDSTWRTDAPDTNETTAPTHPEVNTSPPAEWRTDVPDTNETNETNETNASTQPEVNTSPPAEWRTDAPDTNETTASTHPEVNTSPPAEWHTDAPDTNETTALPHSEVNTSGSPTNAPATSAPGVDRICDEYPGFAKPYVNQFHYDFGYASYNPDRGISDYTACYYLDCGDQDVRLFSKVYDYNNSRIDVFSSMDGENYILANSFLPGSDLSGPNLKGKVLLQLTNPKTAYLDLPFWVLVRFQYWCVDSTWRTDTNETTASTHPEVNTSPPAEWHTDVPETNATNAPTHSEVNTSAPTTDETLGDSDDGGSLLWLYILAPMSALFFLCCFAVGRWGRCKANTQPVVSNDEWTVELEEREDLKTLI